MTMRVIFLKDSHGFVAGKEAYIERSLGRRLAEQEVVKPYSIWLAEQELIKAEEEAKAKAEAKKKEKSEQLLKEKEESEKETAELKPAKTRAKAVKK